jgi:glycosyltransferase involved in cell wall biosynthesis
MIRHSVIIPQHDRADEVRRQLPSLTAALDHFGQPYEIIIVDDGSADPALRLLEKLHIEFPTLRLLRFDQPVGLSIALSAGIRAARGEMLITIEPGEAYEPHQIAELTGGLTRADFMVGRRRQTGVAKLWHRINRLPRWLLLGLDGHDPDCLFWAARREAFADLHLAPGAARYLPALIARRSFRVCEMYVDHHGPRRPLQDVGPNPVDLLATWWHCRRWCDSTAYELIAGRTAQPLLRLVRSADESDGMADQTSADPHFLPAVKHA